MHAINSDGSFKITTVSNTNCNPQQLVELPYKEDGFRMVIVLPNEIDGLSSVIEKASEKGLLEDVFKLQPSGRDVNLHLPKFEIKTKLDLNELLPKV